MILLIDICKEKMHYHEFVRPIEDILRDAEEPFITRHYSELSSDDLASCHRLIIAGTSLMDNSYSRHLKRFDFLRSFHKPVLGICGGMQILCAVNGCKLVKGAEIGLIGISFNAEFLGIIGPREVYLLHNFAVKDDRVLHDNFQIYSRSIGTGYIQAVRHKRFRHYGVLFHPEVRNKDMIRNFLEA